MSHIIDLIFNISGESIPVDHGYFLFSAISSVLPDFHDHLTIKPAPIRGLYTGNGLLKIEPESKLILRLPSGEIHKILNLAGKTLNIGSHKLDVGLPNTSAIIPSDLIYSHCVTTRHGECEERFIKEITRQMGELENPSTITILARKTDPAPRILYCFDDIENRIGVPDLIKEINAGDIKREELFIGGMLAHDKDLTALCPEQCHPGVKDAVARAIEKINSELGLA